MQPNKKHFRDWSVAVLGTDYANQYPDYAEATFNNTYFGSFGSYEEIVLAFADRLGEGDHARRLLAWSEEEFEHYLDECLDEIVVFYEDDNSMAAFDNTRIVHNARAWSLRA